MKVEIKFTIELKVLFRNPDTWRLPVLAVTYFHVCPAGKGLGRDTLETIVKMADRMECECAGIWVEEKDIEFYKKCGWYDTGVEQCDKHLILSKVVDVNEQYTEKW